MSLRDDPETTSLYLKYINEIKELCNCESIDEKMMKWKEIWDSFENLCLSSEQKKEFLSIGELVLKGKFTETGLQILDSVSTELKTQVKPFSLAQFAEKLKTRCRNENGVIDYSVLGPVALCVYHPAPYFNYLRGTDLFSDVTVPEKKQRVRHAKEPTEEKTKPSAVVTTKSDVPDNEIAVVLNALQRVYKKNNNNPIIYWTLVIDPESFSRTVNNVFYVSFLIRENLARIFFDSEDMLMIEPMPFNLNRKERDKTNKSDQNQAIISISYEEWMKLIKHFNIKKPVILWDS